MENTFQENNKYSTIIIEDAFIKVQNPWGDSSILFDIPQEDFSLLTNMILPKEFSAIYHVDSQLYEFIFTPYFQDEVPLSNFSFYWQNVKFNAYYAQPTPGFQVLAKNASFIDSDEETNFRNIKDFHFFYHQDEYPQFFQTLYDGARPLNFFIQGNFNEIHSHIELFKHLNFIMAFYKRKCPRIIIFESKEETKDICVNIPCKSELFAFPPTITLPRLDPIVLELFNTAEETQSIRLKYIFYYQILEYLSYYYLNDNLANQLSNILKNPDIICSYEQYSHQIIETFNDCFKNSKDCDKLYSLVKSCCSIDDIINELKSNISFFLSDINFDGGYIVDKLFSRQEELETPPSDLMDKIVKRIDKMRNVLVHARESRENRVILPSTKNSEYIKPYLYILRRIAEVTAIKYRNIM